VAHVSRRRLVAALVGILSSILAVGYNGSAASATHSASASPCPSATPTPTPTPSASPCPSATPTQTPTPAPTPTPTPSASASASSSRSASSSASASASSSGSASSSASASASSSEAGSSEQVIYKTKLLKDIQSLDRGVLSYSPIESLKTAATIQFEVSVTDIGRGPQQVRLTAYDGMTVYQQDVPTGGIVGVQIVACEDLTYASESDLRQPVLSKGQRAHWFWSIIAGTPGPAMITLRADTYDQNSTLSLESEIIYIKVTVVPTAAFNYQQSHRRIANAAKSLVGDIETIGSMAAAVVAVGGIAGWIAVKRRKSNAKDRKGRKAKNRKGRVPTQRNQARRRPRS
jgi:hypothetical protein